MKILVTGAGGFLGVEVVKRLLAHGFTDLRCMVRDPSKSMRVREVAAGYPAAAVDVFSGNLCSAKDSREAVAGVSVVIHLAAAMKGPAADLFLDSVVASDKLLQALAARSDMPFEKTRVVLVSSFAVYGVAQEPRHALITEDTPIEAHPELRDVYTHSKLRQELLFREWQAKANFELVVLRPGVIYGPGGGHLSSRIGLQIGPVFYHGGGRNWIPLSYVENCAEAIAIAADHPSAAGQTYNVLDDDLMRASHYLKQYKKQVRRLKTLRVPYSASLALAWMLEEYRRRSSGQLPPVLTRYKVATIWKGTRFSNAKLQSIGWKQLVSTADAIERTFQYFRNHPIQAG